MKIILLLLGILHLAVPPPLPAQKTAEPKIMRYDIVRPQQKDRHFSNRQHPLISDSLKSGNSRRETFSYKWWRVLISNPLIGEIYFYGELGSWGGGLLIEPQFSITKHISVGLLLRLGVRLGLTANGEASIHALNAPQQNLPVRITISGREGIAAYQLTADYHFFPERKRRLYAGLGIGVLHAFTGILNRYEEKRAVVLDFESPAFGAQEFTADAYQRPKWYALISPRVGIDFNHFRLGLVYNLVIGNRQPAFQASGYTPIFDHSNNKTDNARITLRRGNLNHLSLQFVFYIGGGRQTNP